MCYGEEWTRSYGTQLWEVCTSREITRLSPTSKWPTCSSPWYTTHSCFPGQVDYLINLFLHNFCWIKTIFRAIATLRFGLRMSLPNGFKARVDSSIVCVLLLLAVVARTNHQSSIYHRHKGHFLTLTSEATPILLPNNPNITV